MNQWKSMAARQILTKSPRCDGINLCNSNVANQGSWSRCILLQIHEYDTSVYTYVQFRTRAEAQKRHEERQAKAQQKRELLQEEKAQKLKMLLKRVSIQSKFLLQQTLLMMLSLFVRYVEGLIILHCNCRYSPIQRLLSAAQVTAASPHFKFKQI